MYDCENFSSVLPQLQVLAERETDRIFHSHLTTIKITTMFFTILTLSGPYGILYAGTLILAGTLLHFSSRSRTASTQGKSKSRQAVKNEPEDLVVKQRFLLTRELLDELDHRETTLQHWYQDALGNITEQKKQLGVLLEFANQTASHLNEILDQFETVFRTKAPLNPTTSASISRRSPAPSTETNAISSTSSAPIAVLDTLKQEMDTQILHLKNSWDDLLVTPVSSPLSSNASIPPTPKTTPVTRPAPTFHAPHPASPTQEIAFAQPKSPQDKAQHRRKIRLLAKQGLDATDIARELQLNIHEVESVLDILAQSQKAA